MYVLCSHCRRRFLTQFVYWGGEWLTGFSYGLVALYSVCPTGACVGEPGCTQCRWGATEEDKHTAWGWRGGIFNVFTLFHLISEQLLQSRTCRTPQQPEDSAYLTLQHYEIARDCIGQQAFHHDQYPFPAASDYRAVHILSGCFSSL